MTKTVKSLKKLLMLCAITLLALLLCLNGIFPVSAYADENKKQTIRISCGINDMLRLDENGIPTGYCKEYLNALAKINNWEFEYVNTSWNKAVAMLESEKLDIIFPTNYLPEREETMEFSSIIAGYNAPGIFARAGSNYSYDDFKSFDGAKIAVTKGSSNDAALKKFAKDKGITYTPVYLDDNRKLISALENGKADLIIFNASNTVKNGVLVSMLDADPFYYTVKKGNDELLHSLNYGMQKMLTEHPDIVSKTNQKCLKGNNLTPKAFTDTEREFIKSNKQITVGFYADTAPLAYINNEGEYDGVFPQLIDYVNKDSNLNIVLKPINPGTDWRELLELGGIDFFIGASSPLANLNDSITITKSFIDYTGVFITKKDYVFDKIETTTIALTYGKSYWADHIPSKFGNVEIKYYNTTKECLLAVQNGKVDGALIKNSEFNYHSKNPRISDLISWENYRDNTEGGLAASVNIDPVMLSVVDKALNCLTDDYVDEALRNHLNMSYEPSFADTLYTSRNIIAIFIIIILTAIVVLIVIRIVRRRQIKANEAAKAHERHQLKILAALSHDYDVIYCTNLDTNTCEIVKMAESPLVKVPDTNIHSEAMRTYIEETVLPEHREKLLKYSDPQEIIEHFKYENDFLLRYQVIPDDTQKDFYEMHFVDASENENEHLMVFGVRCVDDAAKDEQKQKQLLHDALEAAKRASSAKSEFLSKMSHDIRTPMNAIIGMTAIAGAHINEPERIKDALSKISSSSKHLLGLINEVLDMSKIESGTISLSEEEFNLAELINSLATMIQPQIIAHKHTLDIHIFDIKHEDVIGDSLRIQQVFLNIMGNAIKYTNDGGTISLSVREKPINTAKAAQYEFVFKDNGIGMTKEYLEHIFEPFTRAEDVRTSKIQGTGLGMTIAQNIVRMMNGTIDVKSELGKGTEFTVTIFLRLQEKADVDTSDLEGLRVLVVDDDADTCDMVCTLLNEIGMECEGYTSGQEAVEAVKRTVGTEDSFYTAILDWKMPGMNGLETARAIKQLTDNKMPVTILSAYDGTDIEQEARESGIDAFLSKPLFKSSLIRLFRNLKSGEDFKAENKSELHEIENSNYSERRVLLVEDNELNMEIAKEIFEMAKLNVETAENGEVAVKKFLESEEHYYDIIFMDIQMPVMNGYEAARAIRALNRPDAVSTPIVAMTANAFAEDIQQAKNAGMNEHLAKPIDFNMLNEILKKVLDN